MTVRFSVSYRRVIPILIFLAGAVLGKPIALGAIGLFAKAYLYFENGWLFSYGSIDWHDGKLIFSHTDLKDPAVSLHAKRISVFLSARHVEIDRPSLVIRGVPRFKNQGGDWTLEMKDGTLSGEECGDLRFSFERTWRYHLGRLILEKESSRCYLEAIQEEDEIWVDADLKNFDADALAPWVALKGVFDGRVHLVFDEKTWKRGSAHLDFRNAGYGEVLSEGAGVVDWAGDLGEEILTKNLKTGRMRLTLSHGNMKGSKGSVEGIKGDFSFTAGVGAKWEFNGMGLAKGLRFPVAWTGRAFLHDSRPHWAESETVCLDARIAVKGTEEQDGFRWKGEGCRIDAGTIALAQSLWGLRDTSFDRVEVERGTIDLQGEMAFQKDWSLAARGEDLAVRQNDLAIEADSAFIRLTSEKTGSFQFSGAAFHSEFVSGEGWEGIGEIEEGSLARSHFSGKIEKLEAEVVASGTLEEFQLAAKGKEGEIVLIGGFEEGLGFKIEKGEFEGIVFGGEGWVGKGGAFSLHVSPFQGSLSPLFSLLGTKSAIDGKIQSVGAGFQAEGNFGSYDWMLQAKGDLSSGIGFYCPFIEKRGETFLFDVRIETLTWDLGRVFGTAAGGKCQFDAEKTHILGEPLQIDGCSFDVDGVASIAAKTSISWKSLIAAAPIWFPETAEWISLPLDGMAAVDFSYQREGASKVLVVGQGLSWRKEPFVFHLAASEEKGTWRIADCQVDECSFSVGMKRQGKSVQFTDGRIAWKNGIKADFLGSLDAAFQFEFELPHMEIDLAQISPIASVAEIPLSGLEGVLEGKGIVSRRAHLEADFDFTVANLKAASLDWNNAGLVHLRYASDTGIVCSGLELDALRQNQLLFACKIGLLQFEATRSFWILNHCHFRLPPGFLDQFPERPPFLECDPHQEIAFAADVECPSDFSSLFCNIRELSVPIEGTVREIRDLFFAFTDTGAFAHCLLDMQGYPVQVAAEVAFGADLSGRLALKDGDGCLPPEKRPLAIDWTYSRGSGFQIREIDGEFGGVDASFHALETGSLIGSARIDFERLCKIIPASLAEVFTDLKMGKGYEIKGKLSTGDGISFCGLFSGKQIDLFGYQLRTLLAQFEFGPQKVRLYDLKISDSAGMMKIDELVAAADGDGPWTISIPRLTILELRPSLLQKIGSVPQPAGPLVVREMMIRDFKGLLEDSRTYTATGELSFINSYRREHTVFDIPSDLLGRIVGLDLELLIPACGILHYELKNRFFHLTSLHHSFSEAQRSEFFLVPDPAPMMDLDGNLHILVSMKQFVLFKLTESFQILVDGTLNDPQFHLRKKRRFLGL